MNESSAKNSSQSTTLSWRAKLHERWPGIVLGVAVSVVLVSTLDDPGITWDEVYPNFEAARRQALWFDRLLKEPDNFSADTINNYWYTTSDHPSLPRTCAAFSKLLLGRLRGEAFAFRVPSAVLVSILAASLFFWSRRHIGTWAAWFTPVSLVSMPRVFGHAHIFSLDVPMMCWWTWTLLATAAVIEGDRPAWQGALVFGLAFATKLHSVFLPPLILMWLGLVLVSRRDGAERRCILKRALALAAISLLLVPIVYIGSQPWLWHDTIERIRDRFFSYAQKTPIGLWYFGHKYFKDTPWHYPLVMTLFTLPTGILVLTLFGVGRGWWLRPGATDQGTENLLSSRDRWLLVLLGALVPMFLILLPWAQGYDGVRLFLPAFPSLAVLSGYGFEFVCRVVGRLGTSRRRQRLLIASATAIVLVPAWADIIRLHPCQLAYYNRLCGGLPGAQRLGLETTYWCDALTEPFLREINSVAEPGSTLRPMSMNWSLIQYWQERGVLNPDIRCPPTGPYDYHLLQCRQGMFTSTEWYFYLRMKPLLVQERDGVPLFVLYGALPASNAGRR